MLNSCLNRKFLKTKITLSLVCFGLFFNFNLIQADSISRINNQKYPKIANYFLSWSLSDENVQELAKWDILILDMENQVNNKEKLEKLRRLNPNVVILAYVPAEEIAYEKVNYNITKLRKELASSVSENWYLHDSDGNRLSFWEPSQVMNVTEDAQSKNNQKWNSFLADFVKDKILSTGLWDGIFYDNTSHNMSWLNNGDIDLNNDGQKESPFYIDAEWKKGMMKLLKLTREANEGFIIIGNPACDLDFHQYLNGRMFENFPAPWEGSGEWTHIIDLYLNEFPEKSLDPKVYVINSNTNNAGVMDNYRKMRFGLTSALLGKGYYSFDFGDRSHTQTWWYDEYEYFLGKAQSAPYNLLDEDDQNIKAGLWRRDFENGLVIVNSTNEYQIYVFSEEKLEKINGNQDRRINNGSKINWIRVAPEDGVVLLKINTDIVEDNYWNGSFMRIFNSSGKQERNGFFAFEDHYQGNVEILKSDLDGDGKLETLVNGQGMISIYKEGKEVSSFYPYTENFKKHISLAVGDLDGDGNKEIITGAGPGGGPHVRVFNKEGKLVNQFFAYNRGFLGGVSVAVGDLDGDGNKEIITGAGPGGKTEVKLFTRYGKLVNQFFAYEAQPNTGIRVIANDIDNDNFDEILVSMNNI